MLLVDDGALQQADVDRLVAEEPFEFGAKIKKLASGHWSTLGRLKSRLHKLGIPWQRKFERGTQDDPGGRKGNRR